MEKFAVDLDKVLDDFEYLEDHSSETDAILAPYQSPHSKQISAPTLFNQLPARPANNLKPQIPSSHNSQYYPTHDASRHYPYSAASHPDDYDFTRQNEPKSYDYVKHLVESDLCQNIPDMSLYKTTPYTQTTNFQPTQDIRENPEQNYERFDEFETKSTLHSVTSTVSQNFQTKNINQFEDIEKFSSRQPFSTESLKNSLFNTIEKNTNLTSSVNTFPNPDIRSMNPKKNSVSNVFNSLQEYINSDVRSAEPFNEATPVFTNRTNTKLSIDNNLSDTTPRPDSTIKITNQLREESDLEYPKLNTNTTQNYIRIETETVQIRENLGQLQEESNLNSEESETLVPIKSYNTANNGATEILIDGCVRLGDTVETETFTVENVTNLTDIEKCNIESKIKEQIKLRTSLEYNGREESVNEPILNIKDDHGQPVVSFENDADMSQAELESYLSYLEVLDNQTEQHNADTSQISGHDKQTIDENETCPSNIPSEVIDDAMVVELPNTFKENNPESNQENEITDCPCDNQLTNIQMNDSVNLLENSRVDEDTPLHTDEDDTEHEATSDNTDNGNLVTHTADEDNVICASGIIENTCSENAVTIKCSSFGEQLTEEADYSTNVPTSPTSESVELGDASNSNQESHSTIAVDHKHPPLCRPNSLDLTSTHPSDDSGTTDVAPPGATPMLKNGASFENTTDSVNGGIECNSSGADFSPSTSEVSSIENHEGCVLDDQINLQASAFDNHSTLGRRSPYWIPDTDTNFCMHCGLKFNVIKRRHHCRACGMVLCSKCCSLKAKLEYLGNNESRVCIQCYEILNKDMPTNQENTSSDSATSSPTHVVSHGQPNPNNPMEYCSTVPPLQQIENQRPNSPPSVMVPVGVLKRQGSNKTRTEKTVMFSDGIRPGCDLTELDNSWECKPIRRQNKRVSTPPGSLPSKINKKLPTVDPKTLSYIPTEENCLPPTVNFLKPENTYTECANNESVVEMLKNEALVFAIQRNFNVHLKIINLECCVNKLIWCFSTRGLSSVGQDEIVILLECLENENRVPKDLFLHLNNIYTDASKGNTITEMGFSIENSENFLGSKNHTGFLYVRPTYQCLQNVILPNAPYLVGVLIHRWETPWVKIFPLRLLLRLGAEYRYYPCPIISTRNRESVFVEIGHTIINLLADFRNYSFTLPSVRGLIIHMEERKTTVSIPKNRYDQVMRALSNSSDHIIAFAGNFSSIADSHLVCIQNTSRTTENGYSTHAINIQNKPRKVTGASFIILNGALKTSSGLTAKSSIIEDGLMIQILPDQMVKLRESLRNMKPFQISCGCVNTESDEYVNIVWADNDVNFNIGVKSPIDNRPMDGVPSIRVHNGVDHIGNSKFIRWTEVFIIQSGEENAKAQDPVDISKLSGNISKSTCQALVKYLDLLVTNHFTKVAIRATLHSENVSYEAGSNGVKLAPIYMNSLDNELIPVLHNIISNHLGESPIVLELIFHILYL